MKHQPNNQLILVFLCLALVGLNFSCQSKQNPVVQSPDQAIVAEVSLQNGLHYSVLFKQDTLLSKSGVHLRLKDGTVLEQFKLIASNQTAVNEQWERVWGKRKLVQDHYNELKLQLEELNSGIKVDLYVRAYNDGLGIRYAFPEQSALNRIELAEELTEFSFAEDPTVWAADYVTYVSSQEQEFNKMSLSEITPSQLIGMPMLVELKDKAFVAITEANLTDWAGAFLRKSAEKANTTVTDLVPLPADSSLAVLRDTPALSPWRVLLIAEDPGKLLESDLIANFNDPIAIDDPSWITPGASAWDWWWSNKYAPAANFDLGPNQETMKYFIDFAAEMGWEYQIVDWQWYGEPFAPDGTANPDVDITTCIDGIDVPELVKYANSKHVKLIVWGHWQSLQKQLDEALATYEKWGVSGIKIDFMDRQDQEMVNFYHQVVEKAAQHKLLVDFHGAYKPTGFSRTYPNLITREGVMGNEYNKWSKRVTPEHNVTLPFTRGLLGEMDYTPVAFRNVCPDEFVLEGESKDGSPMVQTTRCQQLAMPVVFESALTVFCDSPDNYRQGIGLDFLTDFPTSWDDSRVLNASVGRFITVARKIGSSWYLGGMTNSEARELTIDLSFLDAGEYLLTLYKDAPDANENPSKAIREERIVTSQEQLKIWMAQGGGFAATIKEK